jgi:hypothetical protein
MSIESDAKTLDFNEFKKKYGYKYTNIWVAENEIDYEPLVPISEDENLETKQTKGIK